MIRAFTGPSDLSASERRWVGLYVANLPPADEVRTGCAEGVDTVSAVISAQRLPDAAHVLYVPSAPHNKAVAFQVQKHLRTYNSVDAVLCPKSMDGVKAKSYRIRNEMMVRGVDELIAFIRHPKYYRSGEWMTINIAKRYYVPKIEKVVIP